MKNLFLAFILLLFAGSSFGQSPLPVGRTQINLGVGLSGWGVPFYLGLDYSVHKDITIGAEFSYRNYREHWNDNFYHHDIMGFSGNGNYHFNSLLHMSQKFDFYAGLNIGFYVWSSPHPYYGNHNSGLGLGGQIGFRAFLSNRVALNLEFGGGNAFNGGKFGLTIKL